VTEDKRGTEPDIELGAVTVPSGVLVLGMAGWIDYWPQLGGGPLSERATTAASTGGGHVRDWLCEMVAVPAAPDAPLPVRAAMVPSPFDGSPTIAAVEADLGLPWTGEEPILLGDLPVDRCGMVLGDAVALDSWTRPGRPLRTGPLEIQGCRALGMGWNAGAHSMLHRGERADGLVYPVTLGPAPDGGMALRWTIASHGH
jgi:hypothetical protein